MNQSTTSAPLSALSPTLVKGESVSVFGTMKSSLGDVTLSTECQELQPALEEVQQICLQIITTSSSGKTLSFPKVLGRMITFLSPEKVQTEQEVVELLEDLQTLASQMESPTLQQNDVTIPRSLQENSSTSPFTKSSCSTDSTQQDQPSSTKAETQNLSPFALFSQSSSSKHSSTASRLKLGAQTTTSAPLQKLPLTSLQRSSSSTPFLSSSSLQHKEELISTNKTSSDGLKKEKDSSRQSGDQQQPKDQQQKDSTKKDQEEVENEEVKEALSFSELRYRTDSLQSQFNPKQKKSERSAIFQKKASSPLSVFSINCTVSTKTSEEGKVLSQTQETSEEKGNIFVRFMNLMARILGQAEAEAHELYRRVKARTDDVESLTVLISKINATKGNIDWSQNAEMKLLVDKAKKLGVSISEGYKWSEEEKKTFKENVQMRKESMEKITQLERTDMQRLLQEVSQCHQARSNVLKLLKEIMDAFVYNLRP